MVYELVHKRTFQNQLLDLPKEQVVLVLEKIDLLRDDPSPDGKLKKKLHGYKGDVYRLRSGDYRIIYGYGNGFVALLGVDNRKDVYKGDKLVAEELTIDVADIPETSDVLAPKTAVMPVPAAVPTQDTEDELLPREITRDFLTRLRIPEEHFNAFLRCRTVNQLFEADVTSDELTRVVENLTTPDFDRVLEQPNFKTGKTENLLRFKEGELVGFLLRLDPEQQKYVEWSLNASGPTFVKGGPGTGKSTVALYRAKAQLDALANMGVEKPKLLFTTYTNALVSFSKQLLSTLLDERVDMVDVKTADSIAISLVREMDSEPKIAGDKELREVMKGALGEAVKSLDGNALQRQAKVQTLERLGADYLVEEVGSVIEARGLKTLEEYVATRRNGRTLPLNKTQRAAVWHLRNHFYQALELAGLTTFPRVRSRALELLSHAENRPAFDAVIIDEAQDLEPNALRLLVSLCRAPNRLFVTADANQSIYGSGFRWTDVHEDLKFKGRTGVLKVNYRTAREIDVAARSYLSAGEVDAQAAEQTYAHSGVQPAVRAVKAVVDQAELLARFCGEAIHQFHFNFGACAVLVPNEKAGKEIAAQLTHLGVPAEFMTGRTLDLEKKVVKVITLKSAKGLEFPIVALAGFLGTTFPIIPAGTPEEAKDEIYARERRTLFVGMTRAMVALLVVVPSERPSQLLQGFDPKLWNLGA
jgi:superfamily I DNA/RNA helicase/mRNA-degrading endonuclease RelE of RelBE toxin-antitoxin system